LTFWNIKMASHEINCSTLEPSSISAYLPSILEGLEDPQASQEVDVHCSICLELLDISKSVRDHFAEYLATGGEPSDPMKFYI
jgi:hypothetical protein